MLGRARDPKPKPTSTRPTPKTVPAPKSVAIPRRYTMQDLWRQAGWGLAAVAAVFVAVLSSRDELAVQRITTLLVSLNVLPAPPQQHQFDAESAARQLAQAVRGLVSDRDRLATRLATLERDMEDMTGSVKKQIEAVRTAKSEPPPWPDSAPPLLMTPADIAALVKAASPAPPAAAAADPPPPNQPAGQASNQQVVEATADAPPPNPPAIAAGPSAAETPRPTATPYGADIGTASTMKALNLRWKWLRSAHPAIFDGLQPLVSVRQNLRTSRTELHLLVGPYANAEAATQFCDFIVPYHLTCQPAMFDGSRLALQ
jgi:hypothetical protein